MEVYFGNLPPPLNDLSLKRELTSIMEKLGITDWTCEKKRKAHFGTATFLEPRDAERFLHQHGEEFTGQINSHNGRKRMRSRLCIMGSLVFAKKSTHVPPALMLRSLAKEAADRLKAEKLPNVPGDQGTVFAASQLSCGYYDYNFNQRLDYSPEIEWNLAEGIAKFSHHQLAVTWKSPQGKLRIEIPYRVIQAILTSSQPPSLTLTLWEPPRIYHIADSLHSLLEDLYIAGSGLAVQIPDKTRLTGIPHIAKKHSATIGSCLVYRIHVNPQGFVRGVERLRARDVLSISRYDFPSVPVYKPSFVDAMNQFHQTIMEFGGAGMLPFDVVYQVQGLVQNGYLLPWTGELVLRGLYKRLGTQKISGMAVKKLFTTIPFPSPDIAASELDAEVILQYLEQYESEIQLGHTKDLISEKARTNLEMVYKVQVTPTSTTLHGPEAEAKNRILRRFPHHTNYFVRVQFCDEDGQDVRFQPKISNDPIYTSFRHTLTKGIQIAGRKFDFLGFSHSSLRNHSVWFIAPFVDQLENLQTYFTIIDYLGSFKTIHSPARCAARIGQAFSETPFAVSLEEHDIECSAIEDIRAKGTDRIFSDGVGRISQGVVDAIHASLPQRTQATCFQIRWAGAKGMLALDTTLSGNCMHIRKSMIKFESKAAANLEICDMGNKPIPLYLNRQMIKILEDMGLPNKWFLSQQNKELHRLKGITATTYNTAAFLKRQKIADHVGLPLLLRRLNQMQIDYKRDKFLCSVVEAVVLRELRLLKHKSRIPIDHGVTLYGIVDETKTLEEDEIFITFDKTRTIKTDYRDLDGCEMIVTRSPALHPGDIQLATNRVPHSGHPLRALRNCIVFSQKGSRDLPSQLSGGDLDGDIYNIIWDNDAVRGVERTFPPAEYPPVAPKVTPHEVTREDMTKFFVEFMKTDNLGMIAVKHMILADQRGAGTVDKDCQLLAQLHSTAVDYSKTGVSIDLSVLRNIKSSRFRPDFLAPVPPTKLLNKADIVFDEQYLLQEEGNDDEGAAPTFRYYESDKILGHLYRAIDEKKIWDENVRIGHKNTDGPGVWASFLDKVLEQCKDRIGSIDWKSQLDQARHIRTNYEDEINGTCADYSEHTFQSLTELEVFIGEIFNKSGAQTRRQRDRSIKLKDAYSRIARWAESQIRKRPMTKLATEQGEEADEWDDDLGETSTKSSATGTSAFSSSLEALELSIACLVVGSAPSSNTGTGGRQSNNRHQSFKVVSACCVVKELDKTIGLADIRAGAASRSGGGYVGTIAGRRR